MTKSTFDLIFLWDKNNPIANLDAISHVTLGDPIFHQDYRGEGDKIVLTSRCVTFKELDNEVNRLHRELDDVRERARKRFAELDEFKRTV